MGVSDLATHSCAKKSHDQLVVRSVVPRRAVVVGSTSVVISKRVKLDAPFVALEALPQAARVDTKAAVRVIDALSRLAEEPWLIQGHRDEVESVPAYAISSPNADARRSAIRLVHDLGARKVANSGELLRTDSA